MIRMSATHVAFGPTDATAEGIPGGRLAYLRAHSPRWQSVVTNYLWRFLIRIPMLPWRGAALIEYLTARVLGQPLSLRSWDRMTFNDKVTYRRLRGREPHLPVFCDKLRMREYVAGVIGEHALPRLLKVADNEAAFANLPGPFALKANHGSGWVILVDTPRTLTADELRRARSWLSIDYASVNQEWGYASARHLLYAEELLAGPLKDYKFFVFHGRPEIVQVDSNRFTGHRRVLMGADWSRVGESKHQAPAEPAVRPVHFDTMLSWAAMLGTGVDFVRVDMYHYGDRVLVGELTCCPEAGRCRFRPAELDAWLGSKWRLPADNSLDLATFTTTEPGQ
jgi:TupA-like ATPgrasp